MFIVVERGLVPPEDLCACHIPVDQERTCVRLMGKISWFGCLVGKDGFSSGKCPQGDTPSYWGPEIVLVAVLSL